MILAFPRLRRAPEPEADAARRFRERVLPHLDGAYRYARHLARDPADAEDIVHEAFVRALKAYATCRGAEKAWLFAIVRNVFHDHVAARRRVVALVEDEPIETVTPEAELGEAQTVAAVRRATEALPEPFREALVLRELEELSYKEIAAVTGAPIGTVMSRLSRAREMLAPLLTPLRRQGAI